MMEKRHTYIEAIRYHLPEKLYSNAHFFAAFPNAAQGANWEKIGIENRYHAAEGETSSDLAVKAAEKLFAETDIRREDIDFLIFCALELDHVTPSTACLIQKRLGLPNHVGAMDINLGCSGYVYGLSIAKGMIESVGMNRVLFLTGSTLTKHFNAGDKSSWFVFGDGGTATVLSARSTPGIGSFVFGTDGSDKIIVNHGGARHPITAASYIDKEDQYGNITSDAHFYMNGTGIFVFAIKAVPKMIAEVLQKAGLEQSDIDLFVFHQANGFMIESIRKKMNIPHEKFMVYLKDVGNTVSGTIPIALFEAAKQGRLKRDQKVLLAGFGTGLSWSATILEW